MVGQNFCEPSDSKSCTEVGIVLRKRAETEDARNSARMILRRTISVGIGQLPIYQVANMKL